MMIVVMTEKPPPQDEPGAQERFDRGIKNALATPPKPHRQRGAETKSTGAADPKR
jgi:hypothetical protein